MESSDIVKKDLYALLGVEETASSQEIKKAFRIKALACHPDKNPDKQGESVLLFRDVTKASEILLDPEARKSYDRVLKRRKERTAKSRTIDSGRKKLKDDLEAREAAARQQQEQQQQGHKMGGLSARDIESRLRREGADELERINQEIFQQNRRKRGGMFGNRETSSSAKPPSSTKVDPGFEESVLEKMRKRAREQRLQQKQQQPQHIDPDVVVVD